MSFHAHNQVLIVDDDQAVLRVLSAHLQSGGYEVRVATSGEEALASIQQEAASFLITDWEMTGMDGLDLCRRVRQLDSPRYVYIVFLTGRSSDDDLRRAMDAGADDFLVKPPRKGELLARLTAGTRILRLESHLSQLASHDALTGLLLRRSFNGFMEKEWHRARRGRLPLSVAMLDIDHFKWVNDTHGHPAGDEVIHGVAAMIRRHVRKSDVACRYGGEEFCVLLPETSEASAKAWADELRQHIANATVPLRNALLQVTISVGVAEMVADMDEHRELLDLSDQCLLTAKEWGRDRVVSLRELSESSGAITGPSSSCLQRVVARDAMIPLVHRLHADWPVARAAAYLLRYRVSSAPVTDNQGNLLGIVADKDVLSLARTKEVARRCVADVMRTYVISYDESAPLAHIFQFLTRASIRSVVITAGGLPCGLISRAALVRWLLQNDWKEACSVADSPLGVAADMPCDDDQSSLLQLAGQLTEEADRLFRSLQDGTSLEDPGPLVGGASRMQHLIEELLAGSASGCLTGGGIPF